MVIKFNQYNESGDGSIYIKMKDFLDRHDMDMAETEEEFIEGAPDDTNDQIDKLIDIEKKYELEDEAIKPHPDEIDGYEEDDN